MAGLATKAQVVTWPDCPVTAYGATDTLTTPEAAASAAAACWDDGVGGFAQWLGNSVAADRTLTVRVRVWDEDGDARDWEVGICIDFVAVPVGADAVPR